MVEGLLGWLFIGAVAAALIAMGWRSRLWLAGAPARVDVVGGLLALPRRYLRDVHEVVARSRTAARMHVPAAGGFVAILVLVPLVFILDIRAPWLAWILLGAIAIHFTGLTLANPRFRGAAAHRSEASYGVFRASLIVLTLAVGLSTVAVLELGPERVIGIRDVAFVVLISLAIFMGIGVPRDRPPTMRDWGRATLFVFASVLVLIVVDALLDDLGSAVVASLGLGVVAYRLWPGLRHAWAGALHLAFHPRPGRFGGGRDAALAPLDLESPKLGVETPRDFRWNQLLGFDACVQCGRCEAVCPAFAAGQPLNPKKLIQDFVVGLAHQQGTDAGYAGSPHPGQAIGSARGGWATPIVGDLVRADTLWACTTCRHCVHECPMMIEHVDAVIDLRRFQALEAGAVPAKAAAAIENLRLTDTPGGQGPATRLDGLVDLNLRLLGPGEACATLLWLGDAAFDLRGQRTLRALVTLLRKAGEDIAVLPIEPDTGDLARRLGDEATFQALAARVVAALGAVRFGRIVTADPHAFNVLRNEYPALGGRWTVVHHSQALADLATTGRLAATRPLGLLTYHDPCYLGRYNGEVEAPRALLRALGAELVEMERSGLRSTCCGGGGGAALSDVPGARRVPDVRMDMIRATGAPAVAVACPNCALMLEGVTGARPRVADLAELALEAVA